ncbi:MAG: hypothetical protein N3A02_02760, partial [Rectinema sp.]|nr:hypothetical protein [Rectinema sp.]
LWRDRISITGSERNPDRLALSAEGSMLAVAASTSDWIRIYRLGPSGNIVTYHDVTGGSGGSWNFSNVKALRFSIDGSTLFVLANAPEKILAFDLSLLAQGQIEFRGEKVLKELWQSPPSSSLGMEDLEILSNGWIAACSSGIGRIYFLHYDGSGFDSWQLVSAGAEGESLGSPKAIQYHAGVPENEIIYFLGSSRKLHAFRFGGTGYEAIKTMTLPPELDKARSLALVEPAEGSAPLLVITGSANMGIVTLDSAGLPADARLFCSTDEPTADIDQIVHAEALLSTIISAGGSSGTVSVFRIQ